MILGSLEQPGLIAFLSRTPALARAFAFIRALPPDPVDGINELEGRDLHVNIHGYATRARHEAQWESHRHTADLQFVFGGGELIDWTPARSVVPSTDYQARNDFETWPGTIAPEETIRLTVGRFAVFLPGELHRPTIADGEHNAVRKLVVKVDASLLPPA